MLYVLAVLIGVALALVITAWRMMIWMPGRRVSRSRVSGHGERQRKLQAALREDLDVLAGEVGERNVSHRYEQLVAAGEFIEGRLAAAGYATRRREIEVAGKLVWNVEAERTGSTHPEEILLVGAHYDTVPGSPGANDNGTAVVANLALARAFAQLHPERTIRFVFFVNEESPYYMTPAMGSLRCAEDCREKGETLIGMVSLETIGDYSDVPGSQRYPMKWFGYLYPRMGNFVAVVGNVASRRLVRRVVGGLRGASFPAEGIAAPRWLKDIFRSDHAAFWHCGYEALMITDTANFRYEHYHTPHDTVDKIDFEMLARLVSALEQTFGEMLKAER